MLWEMSRLEGLVGAMLLCKWLLKAADVILWMVLRLARLVGAMLLFEWLLKAADVL